MNRERFFNICQKANVNTITVHIIKDILCSRIEDRYWVVFRGTERDSKDGYRICQNLYWSYSKEAAERALDKFKWWVIEFKKKHNIRHRGG